jgi:hypothetical protein
VTPEGYWCNIPELKNLTAEQRWVQPIPVWDFVLRHVNANISFRELY